MDNIELNEIDQIILGDNQFFGVNHLSPEKGIKTEEKFKDISEIKKILHHALDNGVKGFFLSTHPLVYQITDMMRSDGALRKMNLYVNIPFISKYVRMLNEQGMVDSIKKVLMGEKNIIGKAFFMLRSGVSLVKKDYLALTDRLIDIEMGPFHGMNVKAIFLHDSLTGLAIGYDMVNVIEHFHRYIRKAYKAIPGYGTLNYPLMADILKRAGIEKTLVLCAVNKKGYFMNPSREICENEFKKREHTILAMSTLAAGSLKPEEAYEYIASIGTVKHVVIGVSSKEHANETFQTARKHIIKA